MFIKYIINEFNYKYKTEIRNKKYGINNMYRWMVMRQRNIKKEEKKIL